MALLDLLGRRWTLRILWELRDEAVNFTELQTRCEAMSSSTLTLRLGELKEAKLIEQDKNSGHYSLTPEGVELLKALTPLSEWAQRWAGGF